MRRYGFKLTSFIFCLLLSTFIIQNTHAFTIYVSPDGNDNWSGRLKRPNRNRTDGPVASLEAARNVIRNMKTTTDNTCSRSDWPPCKHCGIHRYRIVWETVNGLWKLQVACANCDRFLFLVPLKRRDMQVADRGEVRPPEERLRQTTIL